MVIVVEAHRRHEWLLHAVEQRLREAWAVLQGRDFVIPDDVKTIAPAVLRHRILLTPEKEMEGAKPADVISNILRKIAVNELGSLGDTSTLADPSVVDDLVKNRVAAPPQ